MAENTIEIANEDELPPNNIVVAEENELPPVKKKELTEPTTTSSSGVFGQYEDILAKNKKVKADLGITETKQTLPTPPKGSDYAFGKPPQLTFDNKAKEDIIKVDEKKNLIKSTLVNIADRRKSTLEEAKQLQEDIKPMVDEYESLKNTYEQTKDTEVAQRINELVPQLNKADEYLKEIEKKYSEDGQRLEILNKGYDVYKNKETKVYDNPFVAIINNSVNKISEGLGTMLEQASLASVDPETMVLRVADKITGNETAPKDFISNALQFAGKTLQESAEQNRQKVNPAYTEDVFKNPNLANIGYQLGNSIADMGAVAAMYTLNPVAGALTSYTQSVGDLHQSAKEAGLDDNTANMFALGTGAIVSALDVYGVDKVMEGFTKKSLIKELSKKALPELINKEVTQEVFDKVISKSLIDVGKEIASGVIKPMTTELVTGVGQELATIGGERLANEITGEQNFSEDDIGKRLIQSGISEAVAGGIISGSLSAKNAIYSNKNIYKNLVSNISDPEDSKIFNEILDKKLETEEISKEEYDNIKNNVAKLKEFEAKIPNQIIDVDKRFDAVNLVQEKEMLKQEIEGKDEALIEPQKERINQINEELKQIANPQATKEGETIKTITNENQNRSIQENANEKNVGERNGQNEKGGQGESKTSPVLQNEKGRESLLSESAKVAEPVSSVSEAEKLKQDLDKEIEIAKQKLRKAASGSLSSGGLQAIPEFVDLVKLYYKKGQYKIDEVILIAKTFFGDKFTEKQIKDAHDKIISEEIKINEDLRNKVEKEKGKAETIKTESNKKITELKNKIKTEKSDINSAKKTVKEYIDANKQDLKGLSENQLINLAKKATNATNVKQLNDLVDYIDNVSKDGNYANVYDSAKKSFKDLKKLAKNKKSLANLSNAIKAITEVSPTSNWDIDKIKEYNRIAELINESVKVAGVDNNGNLKNADMNISEQEILDYADKLQSEYRNDMETNLREQFGNLGINADDLSLRELQQILKDLNSTTNIDAQQAELSKLADKANLVRLLNDLVDSKINDLKGIDTSKLSESELNYYKKIIDIDTSKLDSADLALLNNVLDNIAYNEDFSGAGTFINQEKLQKSINEINKQIQTNPMIGAISSETFLSKLGKGVSNMNLAFYRLSLANTHFQTKLKEITGYSELSESYRKVRAFNDKVNAIFKDIGDSVTDRFKMGAIGHITQRSGTSTSEMNKSQAEALKELIRSKTLLLQDGNSEKLIELGKQQEKALIELGILDADGKEIEGLDINKVINDFKNNSPKLFEMVEKSKGAFSEIEDKVFENSKIFKNEIPNKVEGYLPIRSKAINSKKAKLEEGKEFAKGQAVDKSVTKSIIKRVGLGKDRYLDLDFPSVMSSKANEIANTAYTLPNRMFVDQVFKSKEMEKALGGKENADALHKYFMDKVDHQLNKYPQSENIDKAIKELNSLYKQGAGRVLGGVAQGVKQSLVLINTTVQLGKDAPFLFNAWKDMATGRTEDFMDQFPIAMRIDTGFGTAESASQLIEKMSPKERSKFLKSLETIAKALKITNKMAGDLFMKGLMAGDGFAAKSSFIAYYLKDLKRQNVDLSLLDSDPDLFWEEQTKNPNMYAARWADTKVVNDQNINDPSDVAEFFSGDSQTKLLFKNTFLGLSSYSTNFRSKVSNDVYALYKKGFSDKETNKQVAKNIIGGVSESIALNSLKRALNVALTAGAVAAIKQYGYEEPRKEEDKKVLSQKGKEQILFNTANDMLFSGTSTIGENFGKSLLNYYSDKLHGIDELEKQRDNLLLVGKKEEALRVQDKIKEIQFDRPFYASSQEGFLQNFGLAGKRIQLFYNTFESGKEFAAPKQKFIEGDFTSSDLYPMETKGAIRSKSERNFLGTIFAADALISTMPLDADVVNMYDKFRRAGLKQLEFKYKGKEGILGSGYYSRLSKIQSKIDAIENIPKNKGKIEELELQKEKIIQEKYKD